MTHVSTACRQQAVLTIDACREISMSSLKMILVVLAFPLLVIFLGQNNSCRDSKATSMPNDNSIQVGVWGGDHIRLQVSDKGAEIEYDCARGTIEQPVVVDRAGRFDLKGKHTAEGHGPMRRDREPAPRPAHYTGKITGDTMTLTVTLTDNSETLGDFTLTRGSQGEVFKCR
jgi:hypothetical protein